MTVGRIKVNAGEVEQVAARQRNSKTFLRPDGKIRVVSRLHPVHWDDSGVWQEVDDTPVTADGVTWSTTSTPYNLVWNSETLELSYTPKKGGDIKIRLVELDDAPVAVPGPPATLRGQGIRSFVAPELELEVRVRSHGVEIFKILHGATAPTKLTWEVVEGDLTHIKRNLMASEGRDNMDGGKTGQRAKPLNRQRAIELLHTQTPDDFVANPGKKTYRVREDFTGRTKIINATTRTKSFRNDFLFPVLIDTTITTEVTADDDDGNGKTDSAYWYNTPVKVAYTSEAAAFRFQSVNVPQGTTVDSATLSINVIGLMSGTQSAVLHGEDVDTAAAWTHHSSFSPKYMTQTSTNVSWQTPTSTGIKTIDVASPVNTIFARAGWVANNHLRLGFGDISAMTTSYWFAEDYNAAGTDEASLEVIYTAGGGGGGGNPSRLMLMGVG